MISIISKKLKSQGFDRALLISSEDFIDKNKFMIWFYEEKFLSDKSLTFAEDFEEKNEVKVMIPTNKSVDMLKFLKYEKMLPLIKKENYKIKVNIINLTGEEIDLGEETMTKIKDIAVKYFESVRTLKTRLLSDLNYHEVAIWDLKKVLIKCYKLGFEEGKKSIEESKEKGSE